MTNESPSRYARLSIDGTAHYAQLLADKAHVLSAPPWDPECKVARAVPFDAGARGAPRLLAPCLPSKIIGIGRNYRKHAAELNNEIPTAPLMFLKPPSALLDPGGAVVLPPESERVDYEGELAVVIGARCRRVSKADALDHVFGYTLACDVTARDLQKSDNQWTRGKGFDTFCPIGPYITRGVAPAPRSLSLWVGETQKQSGSTADMIFDAAELVSYASQTMTLEPGDLILTGTPEGVGPLSAGDAVRVQVEGLGELTFSVEDQR